MSRHSQGDEVGSRATAGKQTAGCARVAQQSLAPVENLHLDIVAADVGQGSATGIGGRHQQLGENAHHGSVSNDPTPIARVAKPCKVREDVLDVLLVYSLRWLGTEHRRSLKMCFHMRWSMLPDWTVPQCLYLVQCVIQYPMTQRAHALPISRVKGFFLWLIGLFVHDVTY